MKKIILSLTALLLIFSACGKHEKTQVYYNETTCSDPWGHDNLSEKEKEINVKKYFKEKGVIIDEVKIVPDGVEEFCRACFCTTENRFHCVVKKDDLNTMISYGFYQ